MKLTCQTLIGNRACNMLYALVLLVMFPVMVIAQTVTIKGQVLDDLGEPILGANVVQVGTTNGTMTDLDGNFTLSVPAGARLKVSFIGYLTQEVTAQNGMTINLAEDRKALEDVVVIGYGTAKKSDVTGSIASVSSDKLREVPAQSATQALQGRVAGVDIQRTSSRPGADQQIRIRGTRSLTASNDPLIVLDGIPFAGSIGDISPNDIKSMDILKDASATAIYGSRGANGVIIITTNRGKSGKATVNYNGYVGAVTLFSEYPMMNASQLTKMREVAAANGSAWGVAGPMDEAGVDTDWQDEVFKTGMANSHDITISAGTDNGSYSFGGSYYNESAVVPNQGYERFGVRATIDQKLGRVRVGLTTQNSYSITDGENSSPIYNLLQTSPNISPYNSDGTMREVLSLNSSDRVVNPLKYKDVGDKHADRRKSFASYNSLFGEVDIWDGLKYRLNVGLNYRQSKYGSFNAPGVPYLGYDAIFSNASVNNAHTTNWTLENLLTYDKEFGKHRVSATAMYSSEQTEYEYSAMTASGITADQLQYYNLALNSDKAVVQPGRHYKRGLMSWMGRVQYVYDNKYMFSASVRSDGSSVLAEGKKWHTYPAVSIGWNANREEFLKDYDWLSNLKLRVGYGQTSNQAVDPYQTLGSMAMVYYTVNGTQVTGYSPYSVPNDDLGWEYTSNWNYGLDLGFWNNRLTAAFEFYTQHTKDLLLSVTLPASSGIQSSYLTNIGETKNRGFELTLNGIILDDYNGWTWSLGFNFYRNHNEITQLAGDSDRDIANGWFVGEAIDAIYDYNKVGIYQVGEEAIAAAAHSGGKPGDIKVSYNLEEGDPVTFDANGVPSRAINASDRQIIGTPDGDLQGGFNTNVAWKGFDFGIVGAFKFGGTLVSTLHGSNGYLNMLSGRRGNVDVDYWTVDNPNNDYPTPGGTLGSQDAPIYASTLQYFDATYVKIRTISLGYTLPKNVLGKSGISKARIYATATNPFVFFSDFHSETGMDPEPNSLANQNVAATGSLQSRVLTIGTNTPSTRNWILGLSLTF